MRRGDLDVGWGLGEVSDDVGTVYDHMGAGGWGPDDDGIVRWGDEDLGNQIPATANALSLTVHRANSWFPVHEWIQTFTVNLGSHEVTVVEHGR
jgi:hypothetical protein